MGERELRKWLLLLRFCFGLMREVLFFIYRVRKKCHVARAFNGASQHALVRGAGARFLAGIHFCLHGDKIAQQRGIFVVNPLHVG